MFTQPEIAKLGTIAGIAGISNDVIVKAMGCTQLKGIKIIAIVARKAEAWEWVAGVIERIRQANYLSLPQDMAEGLERLFCLIRTSAESNLIESAAKDLERLLPPDEDVGGN